MSDPFAQEDLPPGKKVHPNALDDVPADFAAQYAAGTPYIAIVVPQDADAAMPKLVYVTPASIGLGLSPVTVEDGSGGFLIVFDTDGNVVYANG